MIYVLQYAGCIGGDFVLVEHERGTTSGHLPVRRPSPLGLCRTARDKQKAAKTVSAEREGALDLTLDLVSFCSNISPYELNVIMFLSRCQRSNQF